MAKESTNPQLLAAKLGALLRDLGLDDVAKVTPAGGGAATIVGRTGYVLHGPEHGVRALGPALLWAFKVGNLDEIVLFSDDHAPDLARSPREEEPALR